MADFSWMDEALCREVGTNVFFPDAADPHTINKDIADAKKVCNTCAVSAECLEYGLDEQHGIWGATTRNERVKIKRRRNQARHAGPNVVSFPVRAW